MTKMVVSRKSKKVKECINILVELSLFYSSIIINKVSKIYYTHYTYIAPSLAAAFLKAFTCSI